MTLCFKIWVTSLSLCCNLLRNHEIYSYVRKNIFFKDDNTNKHVFFSKPVWKFTKYFSNLRIHIIISGIIFCGQHDENAILIFKVSIKMISIHSWHWKILHGWQLFFVCVIKVGYCIKYYRAMQLLMIGLAASWI